MTQGAMNTGARLTAAVCAYAEAVREALRNGQSPPAPSGGDMTATDVLIAVDALLRAADVEIFEIQIWRSLGLAGAPAAAADEPGV